MCERLLRNRNHVMDGILLIACCCHRMEHGTHHNLQMGMDGGTIKKALFVPALWGLTCPPPLSKQWQTQKSFWVWAQPMRHYFVMPSLIDWAPTQNDLCSHSEYGLSQWLPSLSYIWLGPIPKMTHWIQFRMKVNQINQQRDAAELQWSVRPVLLGPLLLTWFNFNPSMDK